MYRFGRTTRRIQVWFGWDADRGSSLLFPVRSGFGSPSPLITREHARLAHIHSHCVRQTDIFITMSTRFEQHEPTTSCGLAARVEAGQPTFAWDDLKAEYASPGGVESKAPRTGGEGAHRDPRKGRAAFYDREALREQLKALQDENRDLSDKEVGLGLRLAKAQATLSGMRTKKRALSEEKTLDEAASVVPVKGTAGGRSVHIWGRKYRDSNADGASARHEARDQRHQEEANVSNNDSATRYIESAFGGTAVACHHAHVSL